MYSPLSVEKGCPSLFSLGGGFYELLVRLSNRLFLNNSSNLLLLKMFVEQMFEDMPRCDELNAAKKVVQDLTGQNSKSRRTGRPQCLTSSSTFRPLGPALRHWRRLSSSCRES
ncbi:uncharacterized protein LOC18022337 [Eutrema salsugineum]|uniref:uncharacterized protein LOC18022337 n=1 Tax=Eutrema salsugineum TaxID=72664 RepID=UPI000CECEB3A|nr:uncharacterized protein LOC18022337 [Eutrema salsugineum]